MVNNSIDIRIKFKKEDRAIFMSHLDLQKTMQRALKRTSLPVWYTMGYNPHAYVAFPMSLSLGFESECEFMDFAIETDVPLDEIEAQLKKTMPDGLTLVSVGYPKYSNKDIGFSFYNVEIEPYAKADETCDKMLEYFKSDVVEITKFSKKKEPKTIDITGKFSLLKLYSIRNSVRMVICLPSGTEENINPMSVLESFSAKYDVKYAVVRIKRTKIFTKDQDVFS